MVFTQLYLECGELGVIGKSRGRVRENSRGVEWVLFACALSFPEFGFRGFRSLRNLKEAKITWLTRGFGSWSRD